MKNDDILSLKGHDPITQTRILMQAAINAARAEREALEAQHGQVWDSEELSRDFTVTGFLAPFITVTRKSDNAKGGMLFQHAPRYYWGFEPHEKG